MFLSFKNGEDDIDTMLSMCISVLRDNMCEMCAKTSNFFNLLVIVSLASLCVGSKFADGKETRVIRIAMIGDSLTQGFGLMPEDNLVSQLQMRVLAENYPIELLNFGVSGDTTSGGLARLDWTISSDISGVVIILGGNDMLRGIPPEHSYQNLKNMIIKADTRDLPILLVGMTASNNFGSDYKVAFDKVFERLRDEFNLFYYENFFKALDQDNIPLFLSFMQSDGIHPNSKGVKKIIDGFYPTFQNFVRHISNID